VLMAYDYQFPNPKILNDLNDEYRITFIKTVTALRNRICRLTQHDIVLIESRHGKYLPRVVDGLNVLKVSPTQMPLPISIKFYWLFFLKYRRYNRLSRYILSLIRITKARVVLSTDAISQLTEIKKANSNVEVIAVMHGLYIAQPDELRIREAWKDKEDSEVTLFSLGEYDKSHYERWGNHHSLIIAAGSLNDSIYRTLPTTNSRSKFDICVVEGSVDPLAQKQFAKIRLSNWIKITEFVKRIADQYDLKIIVALSQSTKKDAVRQWFASRFDDNLCFVDDSKEFATYRAIDEALISIGETSTSLIEGLSRGNKILSLNFTDSTLLDLPVHPINRLHQPSYTIFQNHFHNLLNMSEDNYQNLTRESSYFLNSYDLASSTHVMLRRFIETTILGQ